MIRHSQTLLEDEDIEAALRQLQTGVINDSDTTREFEESLCHYIGGEEATATSSGTLALVLALKSLNIGEDNWVVAPTYVCEDVADAIEYVGARPVFIDINEDYNISVADLNAKLSILREKGISPMAIIVPHMFGRPADIEALLQFDIPIIEDCAHSIGVGFKGKMLGSFGYASVFSFHALKSIVCGEGGMVVWNDLQHITKRVPVDYHLSNVLSAIGIRQLSRIVQILDRRSQIVSNYQSLMDACGELDIFKKPVIASGKGSLLRYCIQAPDWMDIDELKSMMEKSGVVVQKPVKKLLHHYMEQEIPFDCPNSETVFKHTLSLPAHLHVSDSDIKRVVEVLVDCVRRLSLK